MGYEIVRFPYDGAIDADGHVLEPATLWQDYLEAKYRGAGARTAGGAAVGGDAREGARRNVARIYGLG